MFAKSGNYFFTHCGDLLARPSLQNGFNLVIMKSLHPQDSLLESRITAGHPGPDHDTTTATFVEKMVTFIVKM